MRLILSVLIPLFLLASCEKEKENIQLPLVENTSCALHPRCYRGSILLMV